MGPKLPSDLRAVSYKRVNPRLYINQGSRPEGRPRVGRDIYTLTTGALVKYFRIYHASPEGYSSRRYSTNQTT